MNRAYVTSFTSRRNESGNVQYMEESVLGYRITSDVSAFYDRKVNMWAVIYTGNGMLMCYTKTLQNARIVAYAFLPHSLQTSERLTTDYGTPYIQWNDREVKDLCRETYNDLAECGIRIRL